MSNWENLKSQLRKGFLDFAILLVIGRRKVYSSEIIEKLAKSELEVSEGTLYPLLNRLKKAGYLDYDWRESKSGPPRKYYFLTEAGAEILLEFRENWTQMTNSINSLINQYEEGN